MNLMTG